MAPQVVAVGGTVSSAVVEVVAGLSRRVGLAIVAVCPVLDVAELTDQTVVIADGRLSLEPDRVYVVPPGRLVRIAAGELVDGESTVAPFDTLLESMADALGHDGVGIVLAGSGTDGIEGIKRLKEAGGLTVAQHVDGRGSDLPNGAIESGRVDVVLPLAKIAPQVIALLGATLEPESDDEALQDVLTIIRVQIGHDFSAYKRATLYRRIARRMQVHGCTTLAAYAAYLREHPPEVECVLRDFLISVTHFFRDSDVFEALARDVVPKLFAAKGPNDHVRAWIAGCATGEEAYSIGMLMLEHAGTLRAPPAIQLFATDIDEPALAEARHGTYAESIASAVSPERLARFFTRENGRYRVTKELRELVLFSPHNVLRDPPFSRLDLVSCRNLLIYLDREAQQRVLSMFHFGLRLEGVLLLGSSESAESSAMFGALDAKDRIFSRRVAPLVPISDPPVAPARWQIPQSPLPSHLPRERNVSLGELHYRLVEYYAPPSALIDASLDVIHLSESAGRFFQLAGGEPTRQLLRLVITPLRLELRSAIYAARQQGSDTRVVRYVEDGEGKSVELRVRAVDLPELAHGAMLVMFENADAGVAVPNAEPIGVAIEPVVREIEEDLQRTRSQLRTTIEQYETSLEELKASNEELQAINEELRSATEELETSKEELQSVNEELTTLNHELKLNVDEVRRANSDLQNLMASTEIGVIFLDRDLAIKRFTPRAVDLFNIIATDVGRPLAHLTHRLQHQDLSGTAQTVLETQRIVETEIAATTGQTYLVRWLPYRSLDDRIDGVVLTFIDVSDVRDAVAAQRRSEDRLQLALQAAPVAVLSFDATLTLTWAFAMGRELAQPLEIFTPPDRAKLDEVVRSVARSGVGERTELAVGGRTYDFRIDAMATGVSAVGFDITPSKLAEVSLRDADRRKDEFLATLSHELRNPLAPMKIALDVAKLVDHDPEKRAHSHAVMGRQLDMLSKLVDELLDLSRITQGRIDLVLSRIDIRDVITLAIEATASAVATPNHELVVGETPDAIFVRADQQRLVQVFSNLIGNAAKYTPARGRIEITASTRDGRAVVRVIDNGVGIPADAIANIFEIFVQSRDARGRAKGGLGVGLNIVQRLVGLHGGAVSVASEGAGRGSAFTVELPLEPAS